MGDGTVLARPIFLTEPCTDEIPDPDEVVVHPARIVKASVQSIETLTHDIRRLALKPARPIEFSPGQYAQLHVLLALRGRHPALRLHIVVTRASSTSCPNPRVWLRLD